ncbi:MAG TPA: lipoprotein-releasing ABC transporter permease subunit [Gammaproteobacteria bacterium]
MRQPYELSIALRYLRARSGDSFISFISGVSMLGIGVAVAVLIVVLSVMNGFETQLQERTLAMVSDATISGYEGPLEDWRDLASQARARDGVVAVAPFVEGQGMAVAGEEIAGVTIRGVDPAYEREVSGIEGFMRQGTLEALEPGRFAIVIGASLARTLGVGLGDELVLVLAEGRVTPLGVLPTVRTFTVAGIFDSGMYEYDRLLVLTAFEDASRLFRTGGRATGVRLHVEDRYQARAIATDVARRYARAHGVNFYYDDWTRQHVNLLRSIQITKAIMFVILSLVIAVAAFNIVSTLMMVVREKRGDIAILRSFGATPRSVMTVFGLQGTLVGAAGTALGVLLALLVTWQLGDVVGWIEALTGVDLLPEEVYFLSELPSELRPLEIAEICLLALVLAVAATFYPALTAARQQPAEVLRYE